MLGHLRRTTRLDVGLVLTFSGLAYLVWALVAGLSRYLIAEMIKSNAFHGIKPKGITHVVQMFFVDSGFVIDIVGVVWMALTLLLVVQSSRQKISVSWAWASAVMQSFVAGLGAMLVGYAAYLPHVLSPEKQDARESIGQQLSTVSWPILLPVAILIWTTFLVWLLVERARLNRRGGMSIRDGMKSNVFK